VNTFEAIVVIAFTAQVVKVNTFEAIVVTAYCPSCKSEYI
jgi:hypothetical protein